MTSKHKEIEKSLKGMDHFQEVGFSALNWVLKHKAKFTGVTVGLLVAIGAFFGWQSYQSSQESKRVNALSQIEMVYQDEVEKAEKQRDELRKQIDALTPKVKEGQEKSKDKKPEDKDPKIAELEKKIEAIKPDHKVSSGQFLAFYEQNATNSQGWAAGMKAAAYSIESKDFKGASSLLEKIVAASKSSPFYQVQGRLVHASILEELSEYDRALEQVKAIEAKASDDLKPMILLTKGRLQLLKKADAEAKATFDTIIQKYATSNEADKARSLMMLL